MTIPVDISLIHPDAVVPEYKTAGAAAFDLAVIEEKTIEPGQIVKFQTGLVVRVPQQHVLVLAARSSNANKAIQMANGIGIIDQDYCGPEDQLFLALYNIGSEPYTVKKGERIAQGLFLPVSQAQFSLKETLTSVNRGGFGSTG
jgi:dUTP pyrophosphatase